MMQDINIFEELFTSTEMWGYFGPLAVVIFGYFLTKKDKPLGIFFMIVDSLLIWTYLSMVAVTPDYWWHIIILVLGVFSLAFSMWN